MPRQSRTTILLLGVCAVLLFFSVCRSGTGSSSAVSSQQPGQPDGRVGGDEGARILKATMLYGRSSELYERALRTHDRHNERHGYRMHVLRNQVMDGYWNKLVYLLSLLVEELGKPAKERAEWIMYFDAPTILLNPSLPLSTFLPPPNSAFSTDAHFIGARHRSGDLCATSFFLRVHPWSIRFVAKALAVPLIDPGAELGEDHQDAMAMAYILNETDFLEHALYQPRTWYNAERVAGGEADERVAGGLSVRFPAQLRGERWKAIADMLNETEAKPERFDRVVEKTGYLEDVRGFWGLLEDGGRLVEEAEREWERRRDEGRQDDLLGDGIIWLKEMMAFRSGDRDMLEKAMEQVRWMLMPPVPRLEEQWEREGRRDERERGNAG
ncbi:glycosyltransferase family 34 protein [Saccharata proteae CBS 121410]|uniref:Glycosyltransferase family 34 protein n=1 Tax=Saccharata proteae CBS 121410 TaxID=1314787 RepID=A0A9P4HPG9_9PEZI|nr:glycosyltransferase family 34 protein [Saccharata proteae CBS 121410]